MPKGNGENSTFFISLRALTHPLALFCIGLLLVNDHILKTAYPSFLTGKLSDFAGLFFFPFLLAIFLNPFLKHLDTNSRSTATIAFGLTALWFTLVKLTPWANTLTANFLTGLMGRQNVIVMDPTDLTALFSLWPAWKLWVHLERSPAPFLSRKKALAVLGIAVLAVSATQGAPPPRILRVETMDGIPYLYFEETRRGGLSHKILFSPNNGQTWFRSTRPPQEIVDIFSGDITMPKSVCLSQQPDICYRIRGELHIEISIDSGQTWEIVWETTYKINLPLDLAVLEEDGDHTVFAAIGSNGLLILPQMEIGK